MTLSKYSTFENFPDLINFWDYSNNFWFSSKNIQLFKHRNFGDFSRNSQRFLVEFYSFVFLSWFAVVVSWFWFFPGKHGGADRTELDVWPADVPLDVLFTRLYLLFSGLRRRFLAESLGERKAIRSSPVPPSSHTHWEVFFPLQQLLRNRLCSEKLNEAPCERRHTNAERRQRLQGSWPHRMPCGSDRDYRIHQQKQTRGN